MRYLILSSFSHVRFVRPAKAEISEITLLDRPRRVRLVACSNPVRLLQPPPPVSSRRVKVAISDGVIESPSALPRTVSIAARRLRSGRSTAGSTTALKVTACPIPEADTETVFVPRFGPSVSVFSALPFSSVVVRVTLSVPPPADNGKRDRNPFKH